jgi:hypothetical protein
MDGWMDGWMDWWMVVWWMDWWCGGILAKALGWFVGVVHEIIEDARSLDECMRYNTVATTTADAKIFDEGVMSVVRAAITGWFEPLLSTTLTALHHLQSNLVQI